ncbi:MULTISPECIES: LysM peptidoglycan-binding domain-containing protein [unclassified Arthrobacter]|uniref:lytic transglycosylase n=1 Tax=unclassified Arthrobacter TaxID=235627 RepID=UPI0015E1DCFF|nr:MULTISPECIES: LysM peptidoglycan-binding domain-containing protein [unclassified Arthrobacter]
MAKIDSASPRPGHWVGRTAAATAVLLSLGLAGCTSSEPPAAPETAATTATTAPTATATAEPAADAKPSLGGEVITDSFGNPDFYVTVAGDTLATVAEVYGFSEAKVAGFNELQPGTPLAPGTRLRLLPAGPGVGAMGAATEDPNGIPTSYTVVPEDTLAGITYRFNLTNDQLAEANKVPYVHEVGNIYFVEPGRTIALQKNPVDSRSGTGDAVWNSWDRGVFYTTVDGDSFDSVGYQFRVGTDELLQYNPSLVENAPIPAGTKLRLIPGELAVDGARGTFTADTDGVPLTYTTVPGDTEDGISARFGVTALYDANRDTTETVPVWYQYVDGVSGELLPGQTISLSLDQPINKPGA